MSTIWHCNKERERNTHLHVKEASWNIASLLSYLKSGGTAPPFPHSSASFWQPVLAFWRINLAFLHVWESRRRMGGGGLGLPSCGLSPKHKELVFWRFLLSYMTSGPFSWWYFLLLKQRFFWYYFSYSLLCSSKSSFRGTAGIHNTSVVVCNLYCDRSSDQQETSSRNLKGFYKLIIINDIHKTQ